MKKPRIGIAATCRDGDPTKPYVQETYIESIRRAGGEPILLYYNQPAPDLSTLDGILFSGGVDIEPALYGCDRESECGDIHPWRDAYELPLCRAAVEADLPVMGICRGAQVINVALGGTLHQDIPGHRALSEDLDRLHPSRTVDPMLTALYGEEFIINSSHHQAVDRPGEGFRPVQWAPDGTVEAIRHETLPLFGVQWHPERLRDPTDGWKLLQRWLDGLREQNDCM